MKTKVYTYVTPKLFFFFFSEPRTSLISSQNESKTRPWESQDPRIPRCLFTRTQNQIVKHRRRLVVVQISSTTNVIIFRKFERGQGDKNGNNNTVHFSLIRLILEFVLFK